MVPKTPSSRLTAAIREFDEHAARGYLAAAARGLPTRGTVAALTDDLEQWRSGRRDIADYSALVEATRQQFASLVATEVDNVAITGQVSLATSVIASAVPSGATILCVDGDFTSMTFPFLLRPDITVRFVKLEEVAESISDETWLVAFSLIQSSDGRVADVDAILAAATEHGTFTYCDATQAVGVHPVDASRFDALVCHAYKWLCCPRGVGFLTVKEEFGGRLSPIQAGWYAGESVWDSIYGPGMSLASTARRFDISPAWEAWAGAEPAVRLFAGLDIDEVWRYTSSLGDRLCDALDIPQQHQAIVTWADADGSVLRQLGDAGVRVSGRAGRLRASFHLWNDERDVDAVVDALRM